MCANIARDGIRDATEAVQALLDNNDGTVFLQKGIYLISRPLIIRSHTHLKLAPDAVMKLADGANCAIIENESLPERGNDCDITVEGGIWDGNNRNQVRDPIKPMTCYEEDYYYGIFMRFVGVKKLTVKNLTVKDPESYAMLICNVENFYVDRITFDYNMLRPNMDGVHVQGIARNGRISNIQGRTNDDMVALNCDDGFVCEITRGVIENVVVDGIFSDDGFTAVRLLSCGSEMRNVSIRNIFGTYRLHAVCFSHYDTHPGEPVWFDNISIDNVYASKSPEPDISEDSFYDENIINPLIDTAPLFLFAKGVKCGNVSITNVHRLENAVTHANIIRVFEDVSVERLYLNNITQRFKNCDSQPVMVSESDMDNIICDKNYLETN